MPGAALTRHKFDPTVQGYLVSFISVALNVVLVVAMGRGFAALVAGAGVAIGAAWSGLLGTSGIFLLVLRPYKVGDYVTVGGAEGTGEIGLFGTTLNSPDNDAPLGDGKVMGTSHPQPAPPG